MELIVSAKERQAAEANKNANILLEELDLEKSREELKRAAAARKREKKRQKKKDKQGGKDDGGMKGDDDEDNSSEEAAPVSAPVLRNDVAKMEDISNTTAAIVPKTQDSEKVQNSGAENVYDFGENEMLDDSPDELGAANGGSKENKNKKSSGRRGRKNRLHSAHSLEKATAHSNGGEKENIAGTDPVRVRPLTDSVPHIVCAPVPSAVFVTTAPPTSQMAVSNVKQAVPPPTVSLLNTGKVAAHTATSSSKAVITEDVVTHTTRGGAARAPTSNPAFNGRVVSTLPLKPVATPPNFTSTGIGDLDDFGTMPTDVRIPPLTTVITNSNMRGGGVVRVEGGVKPVIPMTVRASRSSLATSTQSSNNATRSSAAVQAQTYSSQRSGAGSSGTTLKKVGGGTGGRSAKEEAGWKEVMRKCKKIPVPAKAISRIIGRAGCNINAIRDASGAHIDLDKLKNSLDGVITIRGSVDATRIASDLLAALIRETDKDIDQILPTIKPTTATTSGGLGLRSGATSVGVPSLMIPVTCVPINVWKNSILTKQALSLITSTDFPGFSMAKPAPSAMISESVDATAGRGKMDSGIFAATNMSAQINYSASVSNPMDKGATASGEEESATRGTSRPQPIRSFPIGAWTPVSSAVGGHVGGGKRSGSTTSGGRPVSYQRDTMTPVASLMSHSAAPRSQAKATGASASSTTTLKTTTQQQQQPQAKYDPIPLPIVTSTSVGGSGQMSTATGVFSTKPASVFDTKLSFSSTSAAGSGDAAHAPLPAAVGTSSRIDFTPFNNLFSPLGDSMIQKHPGGRSGPSMNFASVAAAGVVSSGAMQPTAGQNQIISISGPPAANTAMDSAALQAKAPGYRPPSSQAQVIVSPRSSDDSQPQQQPEGFHGSSGFSVSGGPGGAGEQRRDLPEVQDEEYLSFGDGKPLTYELTTNKHSDGGNSSGFALNGGEGDGRDEEDYSPRGGQMSSNSPLYSSPKNPMTLPHIDSNLNPNAPDFTLKTDLEGAEATTGEGTINPIGNGAERVVNPPTPRGGGFYYNGQLQRMPPMPYMHPMSQQGLGGSGSVAPGFGPLVPPGGPPTQPQPMMGGLVPRFGEGIIMNSSAGLRFGGVVPDYPPPPAQLPQQMRGSGEYGGLVLRGPNATDGTSGEPGTRAYAQGEIVGSINK